MGGRRGLEVNGDSAHVKKHIQIHRGGQAGLLASGHGSAKGSAMHLNMIRAMRHCAALRCVECARAWQRNGLVKKTGDSVWQKQPARKFKSQFSTPVMQAAQLAVSVAGKAIGGREGSLGGGIGVVHLALR